VDGLLPDHGQAHGLLPAFGTVLLLLAITAPAALAFGFGRRHRGARARCPAAALARAGYIAIVRGVPDIAFFLFFVIALDQGFEWLRHQALCPDWDQPIRQGNDFVVCPEAKLPLTTAPQWVHEAYGFFACGADLCHRLRRLHRQRPLRRDARGAARADGNRRSLWHDPAAGVLAHPVAADVGLCPARPVEPLDDPDQGHAASVPAGGRGHRLLGARAGRGQDGAFTDYPHGDWRVVFPACWSSISPSPG
jgi:polar amino acid transport system permease protein